MKKVHRDREERAIQIQKIKKRKKERKKNDEIKFNIT